jgi:hypothetical protein
MGLLLSGSALAITTQDFQNPGTSYQLSACGSAPAPAVLAGGPGGTGNFLRLLRGVDTSSTNTVAFDRTDPGGFTQATVDFDFRITSVVGRGEGFGFALLNTSSFKATGPRCGAAEEPNFARSLGIGFDLHQNAGEPNNNHVSVHWNNLLVQQVDATGIVDLACGQWIHAKIVVRAGGGLSDVSLLLTPPGGAPTGLITALSVPGLKPYEARAYFAARSSAETANYDLANVQVQFAANPAVLGQWGAVQPLPIVPIHSVLLPSGKIICWDRGSNGGTDTTPRLIDPATFAVTATAHPGVEIFCSAQLPRFDGKLFQAGGHLLFDGDGRITSYLYDQDLNSWTPFPNMNAGRWYPSLVSLGNGDVLVASGTYGGNNSNQLPQVMQWSTGTWRDLTTALRVVPLYPMLHLAPNGRVFISGPDMDSNYLDTSGTGSWTFVANSHEDSRNYGNSVLYATGKILLCGGGNVPVSTAEVIDLAAPTPSWRLVSPMSYGRRHQSALLLPDGTVLVTGGTSSALNFNDNTDSVLAPELWDPVLETWSVLSGMALPRLYHSESILLPDGRAAALGGGHPAASNGGPDNFNGEVFSPPYLFKGARPTLTAVQGQVYHGQTFTVTTPDGPSISYLSLMALNSMTHSFDMNQRILHPSFTAVAGGLSVTAPADPNLCPPGYYQLFLLNSAGVPSLSKMIRIGPNQPPVAVATASATVEATGVSGASVLLNATASTDAENDLATFEWLEGATLLATGATPSVTLSVGAHTLTLRVTDGGGLVSTATVTVTVVDTTPPVFQTLSAAPFLLRSVSNTFVAVTLAGAASDLVDPAPVLQISGVTSNEPDPGGQPGDLSPDFQNTGPMTLNLRSERFTYVRVYTVTVTAGDASGQSSTSSVPVRVRGKWFP